MSDYKAITALLGGKGNTDIQETLVMPIQDLQEKATVMSGHNPTPSNQMAQQKLVNMAEQLKSCLTLSDPLKLFMKG